MHICQEMQYAKKATHPCPPCLGREFYYSYYTSPYFLRNRTPSLNREGWGGSPFVGWVSYLPP